MSDKQDLDALARQFLDLWEDQVTALTNDPKTIETAGRMVALAAPLLSGPFFSIFAQNFAGNNGVPEGSETVSESQNDQDKKPKKDNKDEKVENSSIIGTGLTAKNRSDKNRQTNGTIPLPEQPSSQSASWPAPFAPTYGDGNDDLVEFGHRIADIEKRLARLESGAGQPGRRSQNSPRKR